MRKKTVAVAIIALIAVLCTALIGCMPVSMKGAFSSIKKNNNYEYTSYEQRPLSAMRVVYVKAEKKYMYADTGVNQFVIDHTVKGENLGVFKEINNVWTYDEILEGTEGSPLNFDNRAIKAFNMAVANFEGNFVYAKASKDYSPTDAALKKIFEGSVGGKCTIYKKSGKIYIDAFYGIDDNNKDRIVISKIGAVSVKLPKATQGEII